MVEGPLMMMTEMDRHHAEEFGGNDLIPDTRELIELDEPDVDQMRRDRNDRTRCVMEAFSPSLAKTVLPKLDNLSLEERSAICIQSYYRGHRGRRHYFDVLYDHFEKEEAMRLEKTMKQMEEGELLVENHQLTVELEDNSTARRNKSRHYLDKVIVIQRAWRQFRLGQEEEAEDEEEATYSRNLPSPPPSEIEELSEIDSLNGNQAMSISTNEGSLRNLHPDDEILTDFDTAVPPEHDRIVVPRDTDSVLSDYSEMADPLKEHFDEQDVKIIKMEDLEAGNTMYPATELRIKRSPDESDEEYTKRVKKMNYLSLAQEFAELKKVNADALPFDMHKGQTYEVMSSDEEEDYCSSEGGSSELPTPCASEKPFGYFGELESPATENMENFNQRTYKNKNLHNESKSWPMKPDSEMDYRNHNQHDNNTTTSDTWSGNEEYHYKDTTLPANVTQLEDLPKNMRYQKCVPSQEEYEKRAHSDGSSPNQESADFDVYNIENTLQHMDWATFEKQLQRVEESEEQKTGKSRRNDREEIRRKLAMGADEEYYGGERTFKKPSLQTRLQSGMNLQICFMNDSTSDQESVDSETDTTRSSPRHISSTMKTRQYSELTKPMQLCFINDLPSDDEDDRSESTVQDTTHDTLTASEDESQTKYLESDEEQPYVKFDSNGDLELRKDSQDFTDSVEEHTEDHDNQETDRLLKESSPDFPEEPDGLAEIFKKIKSDRVLNHGEYRSLMVDYIFEQPEVPEPKQLQPPPKSSQPPTRPMSEGDADLYMTKKPDEGSDDFLSRQARLQAEARMALAQVRPMAHMQLEVEKQSRKKSPMAEMVGIPGFIGNGRRKKLTKGLMFDMNIAQLQVLVNDLHSQIETLNEELVTMLVERDDLHMEQDSMLVDIEDLTRHFSLRRAQVEYAQKLCDQKLQKRHAKRNNSTTSAVTSAGSAASRKK